MNIFDMEVHPAADVFPMLPEDELQELANDIKENGLIHPVVIKNDVLIDGRNRRAACEIAGIKPDTTELNGEDPRAYVLSSNKYRRQMKAGQLAMAHAMIYPEESKRGRGNKSPESGDFNTQRLSEARFILANSPDLARQVVADTIAISAALKKTEDRIEYEEAQTEKKVLLQKYEPDLVQMIDDEKMTIDEAFIIYEKRNEEDDERESNKQMTVFSALRDALNGVRTLSTEGTAEYILGCLNDDKAMIKVKQYFPKGKADILKFSNRMDEGISELLTTIKGI